MTDTPPGPDIEASPDIVEIEVAGADGLPVALYHLAEDGEYIVGRDRETAHILIDDKSVSRRHALVRRVGTTLAICDAGSLNGTILGAGRRSGVTAGGEGGLDWLNWTAGITVTVGLFTLRWRTAGEPESKAFSELEETVVEITTIGADRERRAGKGAPADRFEDLERPAFPTELIGDGEIVVMSDLRRRAEAAGVAIEERDYLAVGGGIGSFAWVDHLRIFGVDSDAIRVIGVHADPTAKWADYCRNSQITDDERIRSNSASTPDNIWGFPGYALRETWRELRRGRLGAFAPILRVFGEPLLASTYTPGLRDVIDSIARECRRIGWDTMFVTGRAIALRKTDDGRYVLAYRLPHDAGNPDRASLVVPRDRLCIARHVHIATGYPATRILPILQAFRRRNPESMRVVNAYEPHDALYRQLESQGGTVLVEGRGIVASRVLHRLTEAHARNASVRIVHVMRYPVIRGHAYNGARRAVADHVELQPFNWPKAAWGGTLRKRLEAGDAAERSRLMEIWGGTTTADRRDWRAGLARAKGEGWYRTAFGDLLTIRRIDGELAVTLRPPGATTQTTVLSAECLIDCTGLVADVMASPFLADLLDRYTLPRNRAAGTGTERGMSGIRVGNTFEVQALRNGVGTVHAAGVITANGPYAAVDSFLGLNYAALRSADHLRDLGAPGVRRMGPLGSFLQWLKWCRGAAP